MRKYGILAVGLVAALVVGSIPVIGALASQASPARALATRPSAAQLSQDFASAAARFGVPMPLLEAVCYVDGGFSMHDGAPSVDDGFGCMHLVTDIRADTLDRAARETGIDADRLKRDMGANIAGGAAILRDDARLVSPAGSVPATLGDWYAALAEYSDTASDAAARLYADAIYTALRQGFNVALPNGDTFTLPGRAVTPNTAAAASLRFTATLPAGCVDDQNVDYPGAIDCVLDPQTYDCSVAPPGAGCSFEDANRPQDLAITHIVIHDIEGTAQQALSWFQNPNSSASAHYIVDTDGTVYQVVREQEISYQAGNWWYNEHSIGIEHAGVDSTGYLWYNATEYLASAKLTAYLLQKYNIPLDRAHVVAHGTIPSPTLGTSPNHVDPGPYWLWDYYLGLVHAQGVARPVSTQHSHVLTLHPATDKTPYGTGGKETSKNFNFFKLYTGPSTHDPIIRHAGSTADVTNVTFNIEPVMTYYFLTSAKDAAGTGDTMYKIWYGENDRMGAKPPSQYEDGQLAWLAVPPGAAVLGLCDGPCHVIKLSGPKGTAAKVYGRPTTSASYVIGQVPAGAIVVSSNDVLEDGTTHHWYEINFNHRQAWVPASEVTIV